MVSTRNSRHKIGDVLEIMYRGLRNYTYGNRLKLLNSSPPPLDLRRLHNDLVWSLWWYKIVFGLIVLKFDHFLSGTLPSGHAAILSNLIKEIARTSPELYFSQRVLLMYGDCLSLLSLLFVFVIHAKCARHGSILLFAFVSLVLV